MTARALLVALLLASPLAAAAQDAAPVPAPPSPPGPPGPPAAPQPAVPADSDGWVVLPFHAAGVEPTTAGTFRDLLAGEVPAAGGPTHVVPLDTPVCRDAACAQRAGAAAGAKVAVFGVMTKLGAKLVVTATAVDVETGDIRSTGKLSALQVEELDTVATRFAGAMVRGVPPAETIELGAVTEKEAAPDLRREGARGASLRVGGIAPVVGYADVGGVALDLGYWFEASDFAIEPRLGLRFDIGEDEAGFWEVPFDLGAYYIFGRSDVAPFVGGGAGIHWLYTTDRTRADTGSVIVVSSAGFEDHSGWGFGAFGRGGLVLFRTYAVRVAVSVDYNVTFVDLGSIENPQSLGFGVAVLF